MTFGGEGRLKSRTIPVTDLIPATAVPPSPDPSAQPCQDTFYFDRSVLMILFWQFCHNSFDSKFLFEQFRLYNFVLAIMSWQLSQSNFDSTFLFWQFCFHDFVLAILFQQICSHSPQSHSQARPLRCLILDTRRRFKYVFWEMLSPKLWKVLPEIVSF